MTVQKVTAAAQLAATAESDLLFRQSHGRPELLKNQVPAVCDHKVFPAGTRRHSPKRPMNGRVHPASQIRDVLYPSIETLSDQKHAAGSSSKAHRNRLAIRVPTQ